MEENKSKFIGVVLPAVMIARHRINDSRKRVEELSQKEEWSKEDSLFYDDQLEQYNASTHAGLLLRMKTHPVSIVLAQAIVESGWGSSRFFSEANNLFGIWAYNADEPRIAASVRKDNTTVYLRRYDDLSASIIDYFQTIARSRAYRKFREVRNHTHKIDSLLPHLRNYSSRRDEYVSQLKSIINQNDLTKYDSYQLDPAYFIEEIE